MGQEQAPASSLTSRLRDLGISGEESQSGLTLRSTVGFHGGLPVVKDDLQIGEEIGRGAVATIREAHQGSLLRTVAVKTLQDHRETPGDQRAFFAESVVTAHLEHPNIVPVHDLERGDDQRLHLIMKRVDGRNWNALLHPETPADEEASEAMDLEDHLEVLMKVCDAVAYAHNRGVLHRDLKPENVMIGGFGEVLVMDWGCATTYDRDRPLPGVPHFADLTTISGTPDYLAPEVARADDEHTGPWSDVFCLGAILYEILTGEAPHRGRDVRAVVQAAANGQVEPPRHRNPARAMPDDLVELCQDAIASEVTERIRSVDEFAARLRDHRRHGEAHRLAEAARSQVELARAASSEAAAGRHFRRAAACCEQALELWDHRSIQILASQALVSAAQHSFRIGDLGSARSDARLALRLAEALGFEERINEARELLARSGETDGGDPDIEAAAADRRRSSLGDGEPASGGFGTAGEGGARSGGGGARHLGLVVAAVTIAAVAFAVGYGLG